MASESEDERPRTSGQATQIEVAATSPDCISPFQKLHALSDS